MTTPTSVNLYGIGVGTAPSALLGVVPFIANYSPASTTLIGPGGPFKIGQVWINSALDGVFVLTSIHTSGGVTSATWTTTLSSAVNTVTGTNGVTAAPISGNVVVSGVVATTTTVGVASFNAADFTVSGGGQVSLLSGPGISTINGDTGSVTGTTVTIKANVGTPTTAGTASFSGSGSTLVLNATDASLNTSWGLGSYDATSGGANNAALGYQALSSNLSGVNNTALGTNALNSLTGGDANISIGNNSGSQFLSNESSNILIGHVGVLNESNALRVGVTGAGAGQQNTCFIAGITGTTPVGGNTPQVAVVDSASNVSVVSSSTAGFVLTSNGAGTPSFLPGASVLNMTLVTTTPYVVTATDQYLAVNTFLAGGPVTIQLPNAPATGRTFVIKDRPGFSASNNITVTTVGGAVAIDGTTTKVIQNSFQAINVIFNGTSYEIY